MLWDFQPSHQVNNNVNPQKMNYFLHRGHPDPENWPSTTITPKNGLFSVDSNDQTTFTLSQLFPNQQYFLKVELHVRDADEEKVNLFIVILIY